MEKERRLELLAFLKWKNWKIMKLCIWKYLEWKLNASINISALCDKYVAAPVYRWCNWLGLRVSRWCFSSRTTSLWSLSSWRWSTASCPQARCLGCTPPRSWSLYSHPSGTWPQRQGSGEPSSTSLLPVSLSCSWIATAWFWAVDFVWLICPFL